MKTTKLLFRCVLGSHAHGLAEKGSDVDTREVYIRTDLAGMLGYSRSSDAQQIMGLSDVQGYELRQLFKMLRQGNHQALELLFVEEFSEIDPLFAAVREARHELINSSGLIRCTEGQARSNLHAMELSGLSKAQKAFREATRILWVASTFLSSGVFPVRVDSPELLDLFRSIKDNPQDYSQTRLSQLLWEALEDFTGKYPVPDNRNVFNEAVAEKILLDAYTPEMTKLSTKENNEREKDLRSEQEEDYLCMQGRQQGDV